MQCLLARSPLVGAAARLALNGEHSCNAATAPLHPRDKTRFQLLGIDLGTHASKGIMGSNPVGQLPSRSEPVLLRFPPCFNADPSLRCTAHSANRAAADL